MGCYSWRIKGKVAGMGRFRNSIGRAGLAAALAVGSVTVVASAAAADPSDYNVPVTNVISTQVLAEQTPQPQTLPVVATAAPAAAPAALPHTGTESGQLAMVGLGLVAAGAVIVRRTRKRSQA